MVNKIFIEKKDINFLVDKQENIGSRIRIVWFGWVGFMAYQPFYVI